MSFWILKLWKRREKSYKNLNILRTKELFRRNKNYFFTIFEELSFGGKIKIWRKIADTSFEFLNSNIFRIIRNFIFCLTNFCIQNSCIVTKLLVFGIFLLTSLIFVFKTVVITKPLVSDNKIFLAAKSDL